MRKLGSPFQPGTPSSLILGVTLTVLFIIFYVIAPVKKSVYLVFILVASAATARLYFKFRKLSRQHGHELIDDLE